MTVMSRLLAAMNDHDLDAFTSCFAATYRSDQPAHPDRAFIGRDQVEKNWAAVFAGVPDFRAELLTASTTDDRIEIGEWRWFGTHIDGSTFAMTGVTVMVVVDDQVTEGRLYMEPVDADTGADIDEMVRTTYRPPPRADTPT